jgi:hypothetical protein
MSNKVQSTKRYIVLTYKCEVPLYSFRYSNDDFWVEQKVLNSTDPLIISKEEKKSKAWRWW